MRTRFLALAAVLGLAAAVGPVLAQQAGLDTDKIVKYYRKKKNVPPTVNIAVKDVKDAPLTGAKQGTLEMGTPPQVRTEQFIASADGKYVVFGTIEDVTVDPSKAVMAKIDLKDRPFIGPKDAKVTIVEYTDYQCPFCLRGYTTLEQNVLKDYKDKVKLYVKSFPLAFHPWAEPASIAQECALQQGKTDAYWKLYHTYFEKQKDFTPQNVKEKSWEILAPMGVDKAKWDDCYDNKKTQALVKAQMAEGQSLGITGTPSFVINGRLLVGAQPFEQFKAVIDDELANAK